MGTALDGMPASSKLANFSTGGLFDAPSLELTFFVNTGPRPVTIIWDSCGADSLRLALQLLQATGHRGVIMGNKLQELGQQLLSEGLSALGEEHAELRAFAAVNVFFTHNVDPAWLLQRSALVVHHGCAELTHAALRIACPAVVTPVSDEHLYFAERVCRLGAGIAITKPLSEVCVPELARKLADAAELSRPQLAKLAAAMRKERSGTQVAVRKIEMIVQEYDWPHSFP